MMRFFRLRLAQRFGNLLVIWDGSPIAFDGSQGDAKYLHDLGPPPGLLPAPPVLVHPWNTLSYPHSNTLLNPSAHRCKASSAR